MISINPECMLLTRGRNRPGRSSPILLIATLLVAACANAAGSPTYADSQAAAAAESVVCDFFTGTGGGKDIEAAAIAAIQGKNEALPLRTGIDKVQVLADRATNTEEERDLRSLAGALDAIAMAGGGFADWDPAYEAFYVKYAPRCGIELAQ